MKPMFYLLAALISCQSFAAILTLEDRIKVSLYNDAIATTLQQRSLTPRFERYLINSSAGQDKAETGKLVTTWTKNFNSKIKYENRGDTLVLYFGYVPLMSLKVVSLNPYTIRVNDRHTVVPQKGNLFAEFAKIAKQEGYLLDSGRRHADFSLLPEAVAEGTSAEIGSAIYMTLETVAVGGPRYSNSATDIAISLVKDGYLLPDQRMFGFMRTREDRLICDGNSVSGKIHDPKLGNEIQFTATRNEVKFRAPDLKIVGKLDKEAKVFDFCTSLEQSDSSNDSEYPHETHSESSYGYAYPWEVFISSCRDLNALKRLNFNCEIHQTFGDLKKLCKKVSNSVFVTPESFDVCYKNFPCQKISSHADYYSSPTDFVRYEKQIESSQDLNARLAEFKKKYAAEIASGQVVRTVNESFEVANPATFKSDYKDRILDDLKTIHTMQQQVEDPIGQSGYSRAPTIAREAAGALGLLECCGDSQCKAKMQSLGVELVPGKGDAGAER